MFEPYQVDNEIGLVEKESQLNPRRNRTRIYYETTSLRWWSQRPGPEPPM